MGQAPKTDGSLEHRVKGGNATKADKEKLQQYLARHPDAYQYEMAEHLGCTAANVCYTRSRKKSGSTLLITC